MSRMIPFGKLTNLPLDREVGSPVCKVNGQLFHGNISNGDLENVEVNTICSTGTLDSIWHTHPQDEGLNKPSAMDYSEAKRLGIKKLCITSVNKGQADRTTCYKIR